MNRPVNFQHHIQFGTIEIGDKTINYLLTPPFQVFYLPVAQQLPHRIFALSRILAEVSGKFKFLRVYLPMYYIIAAGRFLPLSAGVERESGGEGVLHTITLFLLRQKPLHLNARHGTRASSHDGLTIRAVLAVAASEDALHIGGC